MLLTSLTTWVPRASAYCTEPHCMWHPNFVWKGVGCGALRRRCRDGYGSVEGGNWYRKSTRRDSLVAGTRVRSRLVLSISLSASSAISLPPAAEHRSSPLFKGSLLATLCAEIRASRTAPHRCQHLSSLGCHETKIYSFDPFQHPTWVWTVGGGCRLVVELKTWASKR